MDFTLMNVTTCLQCGHPGECLETSIGPMCRPCFHSGLKTPAKEGDRLYTLPRPGQRVFVIMDGQNVFITIGGNLYAFYRRQDAEEIAEGLRPQVSDIQVQEVDAKLPHGYVLRHPELSLIGIQEKSESPGPEPGPDEIRI